MRLDIVVLQIGQPIYIHFLCLECLSAACAHAHMTTWHNDGIFVHTHAHEALALLIIKWIGKALHRR